MVSKITPNCDLILGILKCNLSKDTIDIDLNIHTLRGIHSYKKDRSSQVNKYSPLGIGITPFPSPPHNMNSTYQRPKATATNKCTLLTLTRSSKDNLWQPRRLIVEPHPKPKPRTWLEALRSKGSEAVAYTDANTKQTYVSADKSPNSAFSPDRDYCTVCTPLGRQCTNEFPRCQDWEEYEEEENTRVKEKMTFLSVLNGTLILKNKIDKSKELENKQANEGKTPLRIPKSLSVALTFQHPTSTVKWPKNGFNGTKCKTLAAGGGGSFKCLGRC